MRNRYPGTCYRCSDHVAAGDGHFERYRGGWRTQHATCAIKHRARDSDGSGEAGETRSGSTVGDSAGRKASPKDTRHDQ